MFFAGVVKDWTCVEWGNKLVVASIFDWWIRGVRTVLGF